MKTLRKWIARFFAGRWSLFWLTALFVLVHWQPIAGTNPLPFLERFFRSLPGFADGVGSVLLYLVLLGGAIVVSFIALRREIKRTEFGIRPIQIPNSLMKMGHSPKSVARHLKDALGDLAAKVKVPDDELELPVSHHETMVVSPMTLVKPTSDHLKEFVLPMTGVSIGTFADVFRELLGLDPAPDISGELVMAGYEPGDNLVFHLRHHRDEWSRRVEGKSSDFPALIEKAAQTVLEIQRPVDMTFYLTREKQYGEALTFVTEALETAVDKDRAALNFLAAYNHAELGHVDAAIAHNKKAIRLDPDYAGAHYNLGNALGQKGETDAAIEHFEVAIKLDPAYPAAYNNLGNVLAEKGETDDAIKQYKKAIELAPDYAAAHVNLGAALNEKGKSDAAIEHLEKAIELAPDNAAAHVNLGAAFGKKGEIDDAIGHYEKAIELNPNTAAAYSNLGAALASKGQTDAAIGHFEKAIELDPTNAIAHNNLGHTFVDMGESDAAIEHYKKAIELDPGFAMAHNNLGVAFSDKGKTGAAIVHFKKAIEIDPDSFAAHNNLGVALEETGDTDAAIGHYEKAIEFDPDYISAHHNLGLLLVSLEREGEAIPHLERVIEIGTDDDLAKRAQAQLDEIENPEKKSGE